MPLEVDRQEWRLAARVVVVSGSERGDAHPDPGRGFPSSTRVYRVSVRLWRWAGSPRGRERFNEGARPAPSRGAARPGRRCGPQRPPTVVRDRTASGGSVGCHLTGPSPHSAAVARRLRLHGGRRRPCSLFRSPRRHGLCPMRRTSFGMGGSCSPFTSQEGWLPPTLFREVVHGHDVDVIVSEQRPAAPD